MTTLLINSDTSLQTALGTLRDLYHQHKYLKLMVKAGKDRSISQNSISHCWYEQLARELRENDALGWKCYAKLHYGVPILRAEDETFRQFYDTAIKGLSYEQKIEAMKFVPVTSIMTKPQLSAYLEAMQESFAKQNVRLEFPDDPKA